MCRIQTSEPLTIILSSFVRGEAKDRVRGEEREGRTSSSRALNVILFRIAICRSRTKDSAPRDDLPEAIVIVRDTRVLLC